MNQQPANPFNYLVTFDKAEAEEFIGKLEAAEIDYEIELNKSDIDQFDVIRAPQGGPHGTGVGVLFYVHADHWDRAQELIAQPLNDERDETSD